MKYFLGVFFSILFCTINAQDVNFSQFYIASSYYNPAFVGAFDGKYRVRMIHRDQWVGQQDKSLRSFGLMGDIKFALKPIEQASDYFGIGIYFLSDRARQIDLTSNEASVIVSYNKILDKKNNNTLSGGLAFGVQQRSINYDQFVFEDQFDGFSEYNRATRELLPPNILAKPDLKLGIQYNTRINSTSRIQTGISTHYTFQPNQSYYNSLDDIDYIGTRKASAFLKLNLIANYTYQINSLRSLYPRLMYSFQGPHHLAVIGANYRHGFYTLKQTALHTGASLRIAKSSTIFEPTDLSLLTGFEIKNFIIGLSYDIGLRDAIRYTRLSQSFEISISILGDYEDGGFICPQF